MKGKKFYAWLILLKKSSGNLIQSPHFILFFTNHLFLTDLMVVIYISERFPCAIPHRAVKIFHCNLGVLVLKGLLSLARVHFKFELQFRHSN